MDKRIERFKEAKVAVHCKTRYEAIELLKLLDSNGFRWYGGNSLLEDTEWDYNGTFTCYNFDINYKKVWFSSGTYYIEEGYKIIEFEEFMNISPKSILNVGQVVQYRNGRKRLVLKYEDNKLCFIGKRSYSLVNFDYREDLTHSLNEEMDIVKIFNIVKPSSLDILMDCFDDNLELVWEREEVREMTVAEISKELGYKVKVVE